MKLIPDELEIWSVLEQSNHADFDYNSPVFKGFEWENKLYLFFFMPEGKHKGCRLFYADHSLHAGEIEKTIIPGVFALPEDDGFAELKNNALDFLEQLLLEKRNNARFFDAH
ncbi:MAG: hypothetical protein Fur0041_14970 [Bacteroidia bacterium]